MPGTRTASTLTALAVCLVLLPAAMLAHHGTNISYDRTRTMAITGAVTELWYKNPHPALFVDVTDNDGKRTRWTIEIAPTPYTLARRGWSKARAEEALKAGTRVNVKLYPSRAGTPSGLLQGIVSESGEAIFGDDAGDTTR